MTDYDTEMSNLRDSIRSSNNLAFTTSDRDNDARNNENCAVDYNQGGWWYKDCASSSLNGLNLSSGNIPVNDRKGIYWRNDNGNNGNGNHPKEFSWPQAEMTITRTE